MKVNWQGVMNGLKRLILALVLVWSALSGAARSFS